MKRSTLLQTKLIAPLDTIQMCRDIVEANFHAINCDDLKEDAQVDLHELQARIYTDLEILACNQKPTPSADIIVTKEHGIGVKWLPFPHPHPEPSSADR